jgi:hypothetical protein
VVAGWDGIFDVLRRVFGPRRPRTVIVMGGGRSRLVLVAYEPFDRVLAAIEAKMPSSGFVRCVDRHGGLLDFAARQVSYFQGSRRG